MAEPQSTNFSAAFKHMCAIAAIGETRSHQEVLERLLIHCLAELGGEGLRSSEIAVETLEGLYGLRFPVAVVDQALETLRRRDAIQSLDNGGIQLAPDLHRKARLVIESAQDLELKVRSRWQKEVSRRWPGLAVDSLWRSLQAYLFRAFRRHGIQTAALLKSDFEIAPEDADGLSVMLKEAVDQEFKGEQAAAASQAVSTFLAESSSYSDRIKYISELADGTFNYFCLATAPETAAELRGSLQALRIYLDTNFLFGLLRLGETVGAEVSHELVRVIREHKLPFTLLYHERTLRELDQVIGHFQSYLSTKEWTTPIAKAALEEANLPGVIKHYLKARLKTGVSVADFFRPFRHAREILDDRGLVFQPAGETRHDERYEIFHDYRAFLEARGKKKRYRQIEHDSALLDAVRAERLAAASTLHAGALLLTYDYFLYRFDWESSKRQGVSPSVVLPNSFWQILRPFIGDSPEFDKSFAGTFALPEFRTVGSDSAEASAKLLGILASLDGIPEPTARKILSNDLLIERIKNSPRESTDLELIESVIAEENRDLVKRVESLELELRRVSTAMSAGKDRLESERFKHRTMREQLGVAKKELESIQSLEEAVEKERIRAEAEAAKAAELGQELVQYRAAEAARRAKSARARRALCVAVIIAAALVLSFILLKLESRYLAEHQRLTAIQLLTVAIALLVGLGLVFPDKRPYLWFGSGGVLAAVVILLSLF